MNMSNSSEPSLLTVTDPPERDIYKDSVRINIHDRVGHTKGHVYKLFVGNRMARVFLRGTDQPGTITMDLETRDRLGVRLNEPILIKLQKGFWIVDELIWAWRASDPAYRIASKLGVLSFLLGVLSLVLAGLPLLCTK
jgi:hypothetical protein